MNAIRPGKTVKGALLALLLALTSPLAAQGDAQFDDADALDELANYAEYIELETVDAEFLDRARSRTSRVLQQAESCAANSLESRTRLETRFEPLRDIDPGLASDDVLAQRQEVGAALEEAIARQTACVGVVDTAAELIDAITSRQSRLSEQFLSDRGKSFFALLREFPERVAEWPTKIEDALDMVLVGDLDESDLAWILVATALIAILAGILVRRRFRSWYEAAGGDDAEAQLKHLLPKPIAEFAPLWFLGVSLLVVLHLAIADASSTTAVVRVAYGIAAFGIGLIIISWVTGPLSPARDIKGLIPDHVGPIRLRLQAVLLVICVSYVVLGNNWLAVNISQPNVAGRASMIFLVGCGVLYLLTYLGQIPDLRSRFRALRIIAMGILVVAIAGLLIGYQNLAGFLVRGITLTLIAVFLLWVFLWLFSFGFNYLIEEDTPTANRVRVSLGIDSTRSKTGVAFLQLVADLVLWISVVMFLIYVWDNTGSTLRQLQDVVTQGWTIGDFTLVPKNIVGSILIFAGLIVVVGWIKRWIDRRWLQRMIFERGARDAILTLVGYVGFVIAIILALVLADVDLTGLAIISGALALGIGFGMQEIASNFVSGLILLFERPIRAGDFVSVGNVEGYVRSIRIRATEIETLDNQNVLVPNSELVSGHVTNWVLRDTHGRLQVRVGVAYGSDTERVREILEQIGREHPEVITDGNAPAPRALFIGFGDSSLDFELRVRVRSIERRFTALSDINFAIDKAFREAGITIPFPQRDLHVVSYPGEDDAEEKGKTARAAPRKSPRREITRSHEAELESSGSREDIWDALTDIEKLKRWLARDGSLTAQIGGELDLQLRDGQELRGRIDVFLPGRRLRIVLAPDNEESAYDSAPITIVFVVGEAEDKRTLKVRVSGIPDSEDWEEYFRRSVDRWNDALALLRRDVLGS